MQYTRTITPGKSPPVATRESKPADAAEVFAARLLARAWLVARGEWELDAEASDYFGLTDSFARACSLADAEARDRQRKPAARPAVAESTLEAADYLVRLGDPKRLEAWLSGHSASERVGIIAHIEKKSGPK